ncbi:MAG: FAD-binding oxidoreductase [Candidatus Methanomethylophilaceae archaeon]|jgi:glycolate oxidase|nr:FAD-binding oxidoreductase [Candidatus Methanomethylophilaceae archaeon]MDD4454138.1 FAD-binding oxidoreductase [Candidatus Methanomethylophilaceae archaeon]
MECEVCPVDSAICKSIEKIVGKEGYSTRTADLYTYGFDASIYHKTPDMVVQPRTTEQVSEILKIANAAKIPVVPRGAGTGLCGSAVPIMGGIVMDMSRMNRILKVSVADLWVEVEAGCIYDDLNKELSKHGFFFPVGPGSAEACLIGGMVANNASGMRAVKYGATRDYVLGVTFVKADGEIVHAGTKTIKDSSGYQLARLMCGSEGTLAVITEVTLKLAMKPKTSAYILAAFDNVQDAGRCVSALIAKPLIPASCELMDSVSIEAVNKARGNPLPDCNALCIIEVDGDPEPVERDMKTVEEIARSVGAISVTPTRDKKLIASWTAARKAVMTSLSALKPGHSSVSLADDMALPVSRIPEAVTAYQEIAKKYNVTVATYGHAADGNLHTKMLLDPTSKDDWDRGVAAVHEIFDATIALDGTVTGEHGVGISKAPDFMKERSTAIKTMREIKRAMDPNNILNPGKIDQWEGTILTNLRYPCKEYM